MKHECENFEVEMYYRYEPKGYLLTRIYECAICGKTIKKFEWVPYGVEEND